MLELCQPFISTARPLVLVGLVGLTRRGTSRAANPEEYEFSIVYSMYHYIVITSQVVSRKACTTSTSTCVYGVVVLYVSLHNMPASPYSAYVRVCPGINLELDSSPCTTRREAAHMHTHLLTEAGRRNVNVGGGRASL